LRVLVVEDEMTIAMMLEDMLDELGHCVVAVAMRLPRALALAGTAEIDLAILDVNLGGQSSFPAARTLRGRSVPLLFATGYGRTGIDAEFSHVYVLNKPFRIDDLAKAIAQVTS
jgi:CheY-like chemotaxis protein